MIYPLFNIVILLKADHHRVIPLVYRGGEGTAGEGAFSSLPCTLGEHNNWVPAGLSFLWQMTFSSEVIFLSI